jgi:hypothetical protein
MARYCCHYGVDDLLYGLVHESTTGQVHEPTLEQEINRFKVEEAWKNANQEEATLNKYKAKLWKQVVVTLSKKTF